MNKTIALLCFSLLTPVAFGVWANEKASVQCINGNKAACAEVRALRSEIKMDTANGPSGLPQVPFSS